MAEERISPIPGVEIWRNPKNRFVVFQLHYLADPKKRVEGYIETIRNAMPRAQFQQEYELQWDSFAGLPVYADFDRKRHGALKEPEPWAGLPLLRGWDFGLTPACVICQMQEETLVVLREFTAMNMGAERFSDYVLGQCAQLWPTWNVPGKHWFDFIDPAGEFRKDTDEGTCALVLDSKGLRPIAGPVAFEARKKAVEAFLIKRTKTGEGFQLWEAGCPVLFRGFTGGYRYPEKAKDVEPNKLRPIKDEHSHPHDALQYVAACVRRGGLMGGLSEVKSLSYGGKGSGYGY